MQAAPCRGRRAAERRGDLSMWEIARVTQRHRGPLLWRQRANQLPDAVVQLGLRGGPRQLLRLCYRYRPPPVRPVMIDRFSVGDGQQPTAQVAVVFQFRISPQRRQERLLKAIFGIGATNRTTQHSHHVAGVLIEQDLERRQCGHLWD